MTFPLYRRPTSVVLLDDDVRFLDLVGVVLPPQWAIKLFSEPQALLNYLENDTIIHEEENWVHREIVEPPVKVNRLCKPSYSTGKTKALTVIT